MSSHEIVDDAPRIEREFIDAYLLTLIGYAQERDPQNLVDELYTRVKANSKVDWNTLQEAIDFGDMVHEGQVRKHDVPPPGEEKKPYTTHTLSAALLTAVILGDEVDTPTLVAAILHDAQEDGKLNKGTPYERNVTNNDIRERFGDDVAWRVDALSRTKDTITPGGKMVRTKISKNHYDRQLDQAEAERPEANIYVVKYGADRPYNLADPVLHLQPPQQEALPKKGQEAVVYKGKKTAWESRSRMIETARNEVLPRLTRHPVLHRIISETAAFAESTLQPSFDSQKSRQFVRPIVAA